MIPVVLLMGVLIDLLGKEVVLISGSVLMACCDRCLARSKAYWQALLGRAAAERRLGNVHQRAQCARCPRRFHGSHVYATNVGNSLFGLGAFLTPLWPRS